MTPVLIYTDKKSIDGEKQTLKNIVRIFGHIYKAVKDTGVTEITLPEIYKLVTNAHGEKPDSFINDYIIYKLTRAAMPHVVNGISYPYNKVKELITCPDTSAIKEALQPVWGNNRQSVIVHETKEVRLNLMVIENDTVSAVSDAEAQIDALYTHYTKTDASALMTAQLQAVCQAINAFNVTNNGVYAKRIPFEFMNKYGDYESSIPGLTLRNPDKTFIVSLHFIRKFEQNGHI